MTQTKKALIAGATGIVGRNLAHHLAEQGWQVYGLARRPASVPGVQPVAADLLDRDSLRAALASLSPTHVFITTWLRQPTEAENVRVNGAMVQNLFDALSPATRLAHAALVTGTKHYLGPFEAYGQSAAETPFREDTPRLPGLNFYYTQEDVLFAEAARRGFTWSVHRPHSIIGFALGNAMNMGVTLAVYATLCRKASTPFIFPGSQLQWNALTDVTDARLLARHMAWAAATVSAYNQAFNVVNGDIFRWRWLWPQLAEYFAVEPQGPPREGTATLEVRMADAGPAWAAIVAEHNLAEPDLDRLASWWHTDGDLGRTLECVNDMSKSRLLGFTAFQQTFASFTGLFDQLKEARIIPA